MNLRTPDPTAERLAAGLVAVFCAFLGWLTLGQGGIFLKARNGAVGFVDGPASLAVAAFAFLFSALSAAIFLRSFRARRPAYYRVAAAIVIPPLLFVLFPLF